MPGSAAAWPLDVMKRSHSSDTETDRAGFVPRVLWIDLDRPSDAGGSGGSRIAVPGSWSAVVPDPDEPDSDGARAAARLAGWGGTALGLALVARARTGAPGSSPLAVCVGRAVVRGVPTAARASVLARAPLNGRLSWGQVGGDLGRLLARFVDGLLVRGRSTEPGAVLVVDGHGARLEVCEGLVGASPLVRFERLAHAFGPGASLTVGPAAEAGVRFASLAAGGGGARRASLVGRGGLGLVLAELGLAALHVVDRAEDDRSPDDDAGRRELNEALGRSPRLAVRAEAGSLELFDAERARSGALTGADSSLRTVERHGCRGCPTPCGWTFARDAADTGSAPAQPGRFAALRFLGAGLGLERADDALELLSRCDEWAMDAKEAGAILALAIHGHARGRLVGPSPRGDRRALCGWLDLVAGRVDPRSAGAGPDLPEELASAARRGARAFARSLDLEDAFASTGTVGVDVRPGRAVAGGFATRLGAATSLGGSDPMRTFPFLLEALDREALEARIGAALPAGADDPDDPAGKAVIAWWHQNLVAGIDLTGFCAFSAAGLLADGVVDLDRLAAWLLEDASADGTSPGTRLLERGADLLAFASALEARWRAQGGRPEPAPDPELASAIAEVQALRGVGSDGALPPALLGGIGTGTLFRSGLERVRATAPTAGPVQETEGAEPDSGPGPVRLRASGPLAQRLAVAGAVDGALDLAIDAPRRLTVLLEELVAAEPSLESWLLRDGAVLPAVWRAGRRLRGDDRVRPGDELELVLAIAGG